MLAHLLSDCVRSLDDLGRYPGQGATLRRHITDIRISLLLGKTKICNLAYCTPVLVTQKQVGALQVKVHNALCVEILHALQASHNPA